MARPTTGIVLLYFYVTAVQWVYLHEDHHEHMSNDLYYDMTTMTSLSEELFSSILIVWDPQNTGGQLLSELLLCGTWPYIENFQDATKKTKFFKE